MTDEEARVSPNRVDEISAFYESHPYPPPVATLEKRLDRYRDPRNEHVPAHDAPRAVAVVPVRQHLDEAEPM